MCPEDDGLKDFDIFIFIKRNCIINKVFRSRAFQEFAYIMFLFPSVRSSKLVNFLIFNFFYLIGLNAYKKQNKINYFLYSLRPEIIYVQLCLTLYLFRKEDMKIRSRGMARAFTALSVITNVTRGQSW